MTTLIDRAFVSTLSFADDADDSAGSGTSAARLAAALLSRRCSAKRERALPDSVTRFAPSFGFGLLAELFFTSAATALRSTPAVASPSRRFKFAVSAITVEIAITMITAAAIR